MLIISGSSILGQVLGKSADLGPETVFFSKRGYNFSYHSVLVSPALLQAARRLRREMTDAEKLLWQYLRRKKLDGHRFRRQHPLGCYILDFYCPAAKLAVELDGEQHYSEEGQAKDEERTAWLREQGVRVLRFRNHEILERVENAVSVIQDKIQGA